MALINCPECGNKISNKSTVCIHCGYPITKENENVSKSKFNNADFSKIITKLDEEVDEYIFECTIIEYMSSNYPNPSRVVLCTKAAVSCFNGNFTVYIDEYKKLVSIICEKIISNTAYIRGIDSKKIYEELNYKDMDYSIQQMLINKMSETRKSIALFTSPIDDIYNMMKFYLPDDLKKYIKMQ